MTCFEVSLYQTIKKVENHKIEFTGNVSFSTIYIQRDIPTYFDRSVLAFLFILILSLTLTANVALEFIFDIYFCVSNTKQITNEKNEIFSFQRKSGKMHSSCVACFEWKNYFEIIFYFSVLDVVLFIHIYRNKSFKFIVV